MGIYINGLLVSGNPPTGTAGGSLAGTYPNPTLNTANTTDAVTWSQTQAFSNGITIAAGKSVLSAGALSISGTSVALQVSTTTSALLESTSSLEIGTGDGTASPGNFTVRGANNVAGQLNAAGGSVTYAAGLATGNNRTTLHIWKSGTAGASGTTLQTLAEKMRLWPSGALDISTNTGGAADPQLPIFIVPTTGGIYVNNGGSYFTIVSGLSSTMTFGATNYNVALQGFSLAITASNTTIVLSAGTNIQLNKHTAINSSGAPATSASLDIQGTDGSLLFPRLSTVQKNALTGAAGMVVYDTNLAKLSVYTGAVWETVTSV